MRIKTPLLAMLAALALLFSSLAFAQTPQQQPDAGPSYGVDVSQEEVDSFVDAYMSVQEINQDYTQRLQGVEDSEQATQLQQEAQEKMQDAISESGLSIAEYQQIATQAGQDDQLRSQIEEALTSHIEAN